MNLVCTCGESVADWRAAAKHVAQSEGRHEVAEVGKHATYEEHLLEAGHELWVIARDLRHLGRNLLADDLESIARACTDIGPDYEVTPDGR